MLLSGVSGVSVELIWPRKRSDSRWSFEERRLSKVRKDDFYFLRSDTYCNCYAEVSGKRCNLKDGEGLQVPCKIIIKGQKKYVNILKHESQKINEL